MQRGGLVADNNQLALNNNHLFMHYVVYFLYRVMVFAIYPIFEK